MAVVLSASDETYRDRFMCAGFLAPVKYWYGIFARDWGKKVLGGKPKLDFLHMTDIKSPAWREKVGLSEEEAERRIDRAVDMLCTRRAPVWMSFEFDLEPFNQNVKRKMVVASGARKILVPEYLGFVGYAMTVLKFVREAYPDVEKVDFLVEQNGEVTKHIPEFYDSIAGYLRDANLGDQIKLLGQLIPGDKSRAPLQAADLVCWHLRRARENALRDIDVPRYERIIKRRNAAGRLDGAALEIFKMALDKYDEEKQRV